MLQFFVKMGMKITKVHKMITFKQSKFLEPYIMHNNYLRSKATSLIGKNLPKLLNNSIYGKTLYNHRNTKTYKLAYTDSQFDINAKKLTVKSVKLLGNNVALFHHQKDEIDAMFPNIIGASILDLSKLHMYRSYYEGFKTGLSNVHLLYMDTDSLVMFSRSPNFYE